MPDSSLQETKDVVQLQKEKLALEAEVKALRKEHYRLQLENDALKEATRLLKKGVNHFFYVIPDRGTTASLNS